MALPMEEKMAWRRASVAGRVLLDFGTFRIMPFAFPPVILIDFCVGFVFSRRIIFYISCNNSICLS